jgi:hypothetical protein
MGQDPTHHQRIRPLMRAHHLSALRIRSFLSTYLSTTKIGRFYSIPGNVSGFIRSCGWLDQPGSNCCAAFAKHPHRKN